MEWTKSITSNEGGAPVMYTIKVNKNQTLDNHEIEYRRRMFDEVMTLTRGPMHEFENVNVTIDELQDYINKGYGIKINC